MKQKYLKRGGLIGFISLLTMTPPLATDLYMPSLPEMTAYFQTTSSITSYTMTVFFIFMAIGILFLGPVSDKYGRKPVLLASISVSLVFSILCALAPTIELLIAARAVQAIGSGGMVAISTALIKDSFKGREMSSVLSITQAIFLLAPMLAPVFGAIILTFSSWKMTFVALSILMLITLVGAFFLEETLPRERRANGSLMKSITGLTRVVRKREFTGLLLSGSLLMAPFMAYLAIASYIYIDGFGISETAFSLFFAAASGLGLIGPILYMRTSGGSMKRIMFIGMAISYISAILLYFIGSLNPYVFLISYIPFAVVTTYFRPMVSNALLAMQKTDVGAASSVMNFGFTVVGSVGMMFGSINAGNYIHSLSFTMLIFITLSLVVWVIHLKTSTLDTHLASEADNE